MYFVIQNKCTVGKFIIGVPIFWDNSECMLHNLLKNCKSLLFFTLFYLWNYYTYIGISVDIKSGYCTGYTPGRLGTTTAFILTANLTARIALPHLVLIIRKKLVLAKNLNFLTPISLQPDSVYLWHLKFYMFDLTEFWNI